MDLTVSIIQPLPHTFTLATAIFQKPTNKYLYITPKSYHHPSIFANFITSELRRYRLYCSEDSDYQATKTLFYDRLLSRGYQHSYLHLLFNTPVHRPHLLAQLSLTYSSLTSPLSPQKPPPLVFVTPRTPKTEYMNIQRCLKVPEYVYSTMEGTEIFNRIIICNKITANLDQLLITSILPPTKEDK
jgi:hypothetical protein